LLLYIEVSAILSEIKKDGNVNPDMYKLVIVDDEAIIRNGLAKHVNWGALGFELVSQLEDGKDAIVYLNASPVDVILSDIKMYETSGIDLARYVSEHYPAVKVILLSGYKEFEFAKQAIVYGVCDYILKPVDIDEINRVFQRMHEILEHDRKGNENETTMAFSCCIGQEYQEILSCGNNLTASVATGNIEGVYIFHEKLFSLIDGKPSEFIFFIVTYLLEELYIRFNRMNFNLPEALKKEAVFSRLSQTETALLFLQTGELFVKLCGYLTEKKEKAGNIIVPRVVKYINDHMDVPFIIDDIARGLFISASHLSREFKNATGENLIDYVIKCRIDKAMGLLKENRHTISEICGAVGYRDIKYFHRSFKKQTGYSVKQFLKLSQ